MLGRKVIKQITPPALLEAVRSMRRERAPQYGLSGDYPSWAAALADSTGYDHGVILQKTMEASLKVRDGRAAYSRDSVTFDEIEVYWSLLAALLWVAVREGGQLNVLDFGGSLGTTYYQNKPMLGDVKSLRWNIVEQPGHVEAGRSLFETDELKFYSSSTECVSDTLPNVVVLNCALQYVDDPHGLLEELAKHGCKHIILYRTNLHGGPRDRLCVQRVPPDIYDASYPNWIFSKRVLFAEVDRLGYRTVLKLEAEDRKDGPVSYELGGLLLERRPQSAAMTTPAAPQTRR